MTQCSLSDFTHGYITAALWSSSADDGTPLDDHATIEDIEPETLAAMKADCRAFFIANESHILCDEGPTGHDGSSQAAMAGHDFWLTRCGHGAGFWDGDWPEPHATALTTASEAFASVDLWLENGKVTA